MPTDFCTDSTTAATARVFAILGHDGQQPDRGGGFFWVFADEGIERTDQGAHRQRGQPGPRRHRRPAPREGRQLLQREGDLVAGGASAISGPRRRRLAMHIANRYDFTSLGSSVTCTWRALRLPCGPRRSSSAAVTSPRAVRNCRDLAPHARGSWELPVTGRYAGIRAELLELTALDPQGQELWTWVVKKHSARCARGRVTAPHPGKQGGNTVTSGSLRARIRSGHRHAGEAHHARPHRSRCKARASPRGSRAPKLRSYIDVAGRPTLRKLELAPDGRGNAGAHRNTTAR